MIEGYFFIPIYSCIVVYKMRDQETSKARMLGTDRKSIYKDGKALKKPLKTA